MILNSCAFNDEIIQKSSPKLIGVGIWTPVTLTFFMINSNQRLPVFLNLHNITVSGFSGG
jgi:hypothetical protein